MPTENTRLMEDYQKELGDSNVTKKEQEESKEDLKKDDAVASNGPVDKADYQTNRPDGDKE